VSDALVALTFDAEHPSRVAHDVDGADAVLDVLARTGTRATFFLQGRWASAYPRTARRISDEGHLLGSHSNYHAPMTLLSEVGIREDLRRAEQRIGEATGMDPRPWFRLPFGEGADRPDISLILDGLGYRSAGWTVDPRDWEPAATPERIASGVVEACTRSPSTRAVVLLHTWGGSTGAAVGEIVPALQARGVSLVTVSELPDGD